jgi:nucleotide-binding universal stress UspA family protein
MLKIVVAVDGSENALQAVRHVIKRAVADRAEGKVHLVNVQYPVHGSVSTFVNPAQIKEYHQEEGQKVLAPARTLLDAANIPYEHHLFVGDPAETITRFAREQGCDEIVVGTRGLSGLSSLLMGSVATKIIHQAPVPVVLVK